MQCNIEIRKSLKNGLKSIVLFWECHLVLRKVSFYLPPRAPCRVSCLQSRSGKEEAQNHTLPFSCLEEFMVLRTLQPKMKDLF